MRSLLHSAALAVKRCEGYGVEAMAFGYGVEDLRKGLK